MFKFFRKRQVYLDFASLTPIDKGVLDIINKYSKDDYVNPSSIYSLGLNTKKEVDNARSVVAKYIKAHSDEIIFTASGTEANNMAIQGSLRRFKSLKGKNILISSIEHSSIIETSRSLIEQGLSIRYVPVDGNGLVDLEFIKENIDENTLMVSIMMVNNEIGTIEPIDEIARIIRHKRKEYCNQIYFHTDACQAPLYLEINLEKLGVDLLTLDGHKIYGPRGIGMLYKRRGIDISPIIYGGNQENSLRAGTENVSAIMGFAFALENGIKEIKSQSLTIHGLRDYFIKGLDSLNKDIKINGDIKSTSPHILSISIPNIDNELFVLRLDAKGIYCSTKSACLRDEDESYVMKAIGSKDINSVIRFSFGKGIEKSDIDYTLSSIKDILNKFS